MPLPLALPPPPLPMPPPADGALEVLGLRDRCCCKHVCNAVPVNPSHEVALPAPLDAPGVLLLLPP